MAMDNHNGHSERGRVRFRVCCSARSPQGRDERPYGYPGRPAACDAGTGWMAVQA